MNRDMPNDSPYIGYVLKRYPRFSETFVVNEILAHERSGMKIDIFALGPVDDPWFQDSISRVRAPVTRLTDKQRNSQAFWDLWRQGCQEIPDFPARIAQADHQNVHEIAQAIMLTLAIRERGIQHLHAHFATRATTVTRLAAKLSGISYSFTAHAKDIYYPYPESTQLDIKLRDAVQAVTVTDYNLAYLRDKYGDEAKKACRIYNGLDLKLFPWRAPDARSRHIFAVGRLVAKKGFNILIHALHILHTRHETFHCTLAGDGPQRQELTDLIQQLGLSERVALIGSRPQPEIIAAIQRAAMMVAPCMVSEEGDRDGLPTVLLEAMALGAPVISTDVAGIPELVSHNETGLCVAPEDPLALADAIQRLLNDAALQQNLSSQARDRIEHHFDIDRNSARLREIFSLSVAQAASLSA